MKTKEVIWSATRPNLNTNNWDYIVFRNVLNVYPVSFPMNWECKQVSSKETFQLHAIPMRIKYGVFQNFMRFDVAPFAVSLN